MATRALLAFFAAVVLGCVPMLPTEACPPGAAAIGDDGHRLLPVAVGSCWVHLWQDDGGNRADEIKITSVREPGPIPAIPGVPADIECDKSGITGIPLFREQSDGRTETRWMSLDGDDAVWWEEDFHDDGSVEVYCPHKLRVPGESVIATGTFDEAFVSVQWDPGADTAVDAPAVKNKVDHWELHGHRFAKDTPARTGSSLPGAVVGVASVDPQRSLEPVTVPAGTFLAYGFHRVITDLAKPDSPKVSEFFFARGVGKVFEHTEQVEIESLTRRRIGPEQGGDSGAGVSTGSSGY